MTDTPHEADRLLTDLNAVTGPLEDHGDLRAETLSTTLVFLRQRRRRTRLLRWTVVMLIYGAGVGSGVLFKSPGEPPVLLTSGEERVAKQSLSSSTGVEPEMDPQALRQQVATALPEERVTLLRQAGDTYLLNHGDIEQALNCYQQVLELSTPQEWATFDPADSWLFAELKQSMTRKHERKS